MRAQSSVSGRGRVAWFLTGGRRDAGAGNTSAPTGNTQVVPAAAAKKDDDDSMGTMMAPEHLCQRLGHAGFVDFGQVARENKWNWFKIEAQASLAPESGLKARGNNGCHVEDIQLFRSQVKQSADPQLTVQVGLALTKRTEADLAYMRDINPDSLKFKELDSCVRECGVHGVGRLGTIAQQLIQEATDLAAAKRAESRV